MVKRNGVKADSTVTINNVPSTMYLSTPRKRVNTL